MAQPLRQYAVLSEPMFATIFLFHKDKSQVANTVIF